MGLGLPEDAPWAVIDVEASGLYPDDGARIGCVSVTWPTSPPGAKLTYRTRSMPFDQGVRDKFPTTQMDLFEGDDPNLPESAWRELCEWAQRQKQLGYHNAKYDMTMMRTGTRHWEGVDLSLVDTWDTMIVQRELSPTEPVGLDAVAKRLQLPTAGKAGLDGVKGWLLQNRYPKTRYDLVPWHIIRLYVETDTAITAELKDFQERAITGMQLNEGVIDPMPSIRRRLEMMRVLYYLEWRGIGYDAARSMEAAAVLEERAKAYEDVLPFPPTPDGAKRWFVDKCGLDVDRRSEKTGKPSIDEEQVRKWQSQGVEYAREYSLATKARRAVSMWYRGYAEKLGSDGRLRTSFKQTHVKTGRMSVERVQLQAMPKRDKRKAIGSSEELPIYEGLPDVRDLITAKPGHGVWSMDLSQAELRVAAKYARCEKMLQRILSGADVHGETCQEVLHVGPDDPEFKYKRDIAKRTNFSAVFMVGPEKFQATIARQADIHLPLHECQRIIRAWRANYPEFEATYKKADRLAAKRGWVRLLPNTEYEVRSFFGPRDWPHTAWNRIVQGSLAEAFQLIMIGVERQWPGYMVMTIHDSIWLECPEDEGDGISAEVAEWVGEFATELFDFPMSMDTERYV